MALRGRPVSWVPSWDMQTRKREPRLCAEAGPAGGAGGEGRAVLLLGWGSERLTCLSLASSLRVPQIPGREP